VGCPKIFHEVEDTLDIKNREGKIKRISWMGTSISSDEHSTLC